MRILSAFLVCFLCLAHGHPVKRSSATCTDVTTKLVTFLQAVMGPMAPMIAGTIESSTGMQLLSVPYLERAMCPLIESESIADIGDALRSSGLLRQDVESFAAALGVGYSYLRRASSNGQLAQGIQYNTPAQQELIQAAIQMATHLGDMGWGNLNPAGFERMQVMVSFMEGSHWGNMPGDAMPEPLEPFPGNPSAYTAARREEILLQDIQVIMDKARVAAGPHWPMFAMIFNTYSGGLVDLNNMESINSLGRGIAAVDSLDGLYEFVSGTVLMPLLNFYFPQLDMVFRRGERGLNQAVGYMEEYHENGWVSQQMVDQARSKATTFTAFHAALRDTGFLNLHW